MKFKDIKTIAEKYKTMTKLGSASLCVLMIITVVCLALSPIAEALFPTMSRSLFFLHFIALFLLWGVFVNIGIPKAYRKQLRYESTLLVSVFCGWYYDYLGNLIDYSDNTKKIKRALNRAYTINYAIYDRIYRNEEYVTEFKDRFGRLTNEVVVIISMIDADKEITPNRVDKILCQIDDLKHLLLERAEKMRI